MVTVPLGDQKAFGSLAPYAEKAAIRASTEPIQPTRDNQRGRILVAATSEPAAPRKNAAGTSQGVPPRTVSISKSRRT
jgi:hypothetical protein